MNDPFSIKNQFASTKPQPTAINPLARAMAETEQNLNTPKPTPGTNPLSEALARTGGRMADPYEMSNTSDAHDAFNNQPSPEDMAKQQEKAMREERQRALHKKLHDQINPVDLRDVFNAKEQRVVRELEQTRNELKALMQDVKKLSQDLDIETTKVVVSPGAEGTYHTTFFQQLRAFILLLRKRVQSARTWMQQANAKKAKKRGKQPGLDLVGQKHEQTKTVFDMMHHERSSTFGGS